MSSSDFEDFEHAEAVSSNTKPVQAGSIKKGGYCMLKGFPCKVIDYSTAKPGKHGAAKASITGIDIFTGKKHEDAFPTSHTVYVPIVNKVEYEVANISGDNFVSLIKQDYSLKEDICLTADLKEELKSLYEDNQNDCEIYFTVISACGQQKIIAGRTKETVAA